MATKVRNFRLDDELWDAMGRLAKSRGSTRTAVVVEGVRRLLADPSGDWGVDSPFLPLNLRGGETSAGSVAERLIVEPHEKQVFSSRLTGAAGAEAYARVVGASFFCPHESECHENGTRQDWRCPVHDMRRKVK